MKLERHIQAYIRNHQLLNDGDNVLVALSGGADSVALLQILLRLGYRCHAVHCNFHLRGSESDRDEQFVANLCRALCVSCDVVHFDTRYYAESHHLSIEMAARELRYHEFERIRQLHHLQAIAVAHHQDDAVETLLLNLIRGAGINGLTGMRSRNGYVVRPLLCVTRDEIIGYLDHLGQSYMTDSTNLTDEYARNKVRLNIIPMMEQINAAAKDNIIQAADHLSQAATIYNKVVAEANCRMMEKRGDETFISIATLLHTDEPRAYLFEMLHPYGFNSAQIADVFRSLSSESGRMVHSAGYTVLRDRTYLIVRERLITDVSDDAEYTLPTHGTLLLPDGTRLMTTLIEPDSTWQVPKRSDELYIDAACVSKPLTIRHPHEADRFHPFGMRGTKLLSDFFTDIKLPRTEKARQWLLCHGDDIVWAIGHRSSELYRLHGDEKTILRIAKLC